MMSGYCKECGNQHCICDMNKSETSIFQDEVYKALGWQGGTIHQVIAEIKRLKTFEKESKTLLNELIDTEDMVIEVGTSYKGYSSFYFWKEKTKELLK